MNKPIVRGMSVLGVLLGGWGSITLAQGVSPYTSNPYTAQPGGYNAGVPTAPMPMNPRPAMSPRGLAPRGVPTMARALQEPAPSMPNPTPADAAGSAPTEPSARTEPTSPNPTELTLPRAESAGGGGEPTEAVEAEEEAEAPARDETKLLMNALGMEESPVKVYGWIQNSYTGNTGGQPKNGYNYGVNPNYEANRWMGNQYYLIIENPLEQNDRVNFGFRFDNLFGNDWVFNHMRGLNEHSFRLNHFLGYDPAQMYAEVHLPFLTKGGTDVKAGRFYTVLGYEVVPATGRPLLSVPYMFNYGQPFTHLGVLGTTHVTDRVNWLNGVVNGYDRWFNENYKMNYLGGVTWTSKSGKTNLAVSYIFGPNQYPRFLQSSTPIVLLGNTIPPYEAGRRNSAYGSNWRTSFTTVLSYKWSDKLTQVMETDESFENNIPGSGAGGTANNDSWYGFANWFLYAFNDKLTGVWRAEVFRDQNGQRLQIAPRGDTVYEQTVGFIYKPKPYLWIRPEARYDWSQFVPVYIDNTKKSQLTLALNVILLF